MKAKLLDNINSHGDSAVMICEFSEDDLLHLKALLTQIEEGVGVSISSIPNLQLEKMLSLDFFLDSKSRGIERVGDGMFICKLTSEEYDEMASMIADQIEDISSGGHRYLYNSGSQIELILSQSGDW